MKLQVTFDESTRDFVLDAFGKKAANGFVCENSGEKVLTPSGEEIPLKDFAGVRKGSVIFVKSDIVSLIETAENLGA
jgi:hypothetical protein